MLLKLPFMLLSSAPEPDLVANLLNKILFTFEVVPCLILGLFRRFFHRCASILAQSYKGVGGWEAGRGGGWGGRWKKLPGEDTGPPVAPQMVLTAQLDRRDTIAVQGRIPGWLHPIGALHRCQCPGHGFTRLQIHPPEKQTD